MGWNREEEVNRRLDDVGGKENEKEKKETEKEKENYSE